MVFHTCCMMHCFLFSTHLSPLLNMCCVGRLSYNLSLYNVGSTLWVAKQLRAWALGLGLVLLFMNPVIYNRPSNLLPLCYWEMRLLPCVSVMRVEYVHICKVLSAVPGMYRVCQWVVLSVFIKMLSQETGTQKDLNQLSSLFYFISAPSALENVSTMCFLNFTCHLSSLKWVDNILPIKKFFVLMGG